MRTKIRSQIIFMIAIMSLVACDKVTTKQVFNKEEQVSIKGTWKLISGTIIQGEDTTTTDYTDGQEMIKIINDSHFAFLRHDLNAQSDSNRVFAAGGGTYTLEGNIYTEYLDYFTLREWEGNHFSLEYSIDGDTLITKGKEEVEELNVSYYNIEKYVRLP